MNVCEHGPLGDCGRRAVRQSPSRMCHSHRRMWLAGKPLDAPVRGYQRYKEGPDGKAVATSSVRASSARRKPFEKEHELLRSLGLK